MREIIIKIQWIIQIYNNYFDSMISICGWMQTHIIPNYVNMPNYVRGYNPIWFAIIHTNFEAHNLATWQKIAFSTYANILEKWFASSLVVTQRFFSN